MQSCLELHSNVAFRRCTTPSSPLSHPQQEGDSLPLSHSDIAGTNSGGGGIAPSPSPGCSSCDPGGFYGSQHCCLPAKKVGSYDHLQRFRALSGTASMYSKSALVWSPDPHGKAAGLAANSPAPVRPVSPSSGLVHWMSMMADHSHMSVPTHSNPHEVHYMWNGVESKMNTPEQDSTPPLQKGPGSSLEEGRSGGMESSQMHSMYSHGNHGNRNNNSSSNSPPVSTPSSSSSMLVVPQPINAVAKTPGLNAVTVAAVAAAANGTGRKYQCKMCPQIFGSKADLQLHTQIHMREAKPYKCSQCSKAFANSSYLSQHTRIHLGIKPYRCEICQRKFTQLSHLQQHIRTHTGDKPYKCRHPGCNKAFSQLSNLQSHSRCHQTDKPYKCNSCYKCFADEASLLEHIPKHKESKHLKTHICQFCGKSYTQETYLAKHMQKHADRMEKRGLTLPPLPALTGGNTTSSSSTTAGVRAHSSDSFWQKAVSVSSPTDNSPMGDTTSSVAAMAAVAASHHIHSRSSESCLQSSLGDHPHSRLHIPTSRDLDHRQNQGSCASGGSNNTGSNGRDHSDLSHMSPSQVIYDTPSLAVSSSKTTSAFTPIQSGMLPITSGSQLSMPGSSRTYFPYEPISFPKTTSQVASMDVKPPHTSFPNQLISLHQIRNYASMPSMTGGAEHPISLKDKSQQ